MSDLFSMFQEPAAEPPAPATAPLPMTQEQRKELRGLFAQLNVASAQEQFAVIEELTGTRITAVADLQASQAHRAIAGLRRRVEMVGRTRTGNSWDDRDSPTWIDRL